jgi:prepilin peptidase CpaA
MPTFITIDPTQPGVLAIIAVLAVAVTTDIRRRKIYNALTLPAMALGLVLNTVTNGFSGLIFAITGLLLGAVLFSLPVAFLGRGAGDLKLLAAVGTLGGPVFVLWCALLTGVAGALFAIAVLLRKRRFGVVLAGMALDVAEGQVPVAASGLRLPYAIPIAAGAVAALALL